MEVLSGRPHQLSAQLLQSVEQYRYKVFVEMLGWELDTPPGRERDQFDHAGTLYLAARDAKEEIVGTARLLPTTSPYLLSEVFPQLLGGAAPPCDPLVWELSRFAAVDFTATGQGAMGQFSSPVAVEQGHFLCFRPDRMHLPAFAAFRDWLLAEGARSRGALG